MKVSLSWLKELVDFKLTPEVLAERLSLSTIGVKEQTPDFLELDLTYNRGDLLSVRGVAYEVAAITNSEVKFAEPAESDYLWVSQNLPQVNVVVEDPELCLLYSIAKIEGLRVGPSKKEWIRKLEDSGLRTVNNIADITNLVMLEYGQPMHAFDAKGVKDQTIVVRRAKRGERTTTLDGKTRDLETSDLLIADPQNNLGIAGVMGGKDSEVSDSTTTILLEAAIFDQANLRRAAQRLGLHSEASKRFQHGLTRKRLFQALDAAIRMYQEMDGKLTGLTIVGESEDQLKKVPLTLEKVRSLIGVQIRADQVEKYLQRLGFHTRSVGANSWVVTPPYFRLDIEIEEDLIEEVARMYGYERIPSKELPGELPEKIDQTLYDFIQDLKEKLKNAGLTEVQTYSFYSTQVLNALDFSAENQDTLVKIANPISSETEYLRAHIWPNSAEVVAKNMRQGFADIAIFEVGKVYQPVNGDLPKEPYRLAVVLMNGSDNPIQELASIVKHLQETVHLGGGPKVEGAKLNHLEGVFFHPNRFATVSVGDNVIGSLAEVHPRFLNHFGIEKRVAILEIDLEPLSGKPV